MRRPLNECLYSHLRGVFHWGLCFSMRLWILSAFLVAATIAAIAVVGIPIAVIIVTAREKTEWEKAAAIG